LGSRWTQTDSDGTYLLANMGARATMVVRAPGYADFRDSWRGIALQPDNGTAERDFALAPGAVLEGTVLTKQKKPIVNAYVRLRPRQTGWGNWQQAASLSDLWTHTGQDGGYRLEGVPGFKLYIETEAPGFDRGESKGTLELKPGESQTVDVVMLPAAQIQGVILARDETPISSARITIARDPGRDADTRAQWMALANGMIGFSGTDGSFLIEDVPVGNILVRVEADKFATLTKRYANVEPGKSISPERLVLAPAKKITGKIVDENGKPFSRCWLRAKQTASPDGEPQSQLLAARVKQDGTFELENLPDGVYTIDVRVSNRGPGLPRYQDLTRPNVTAGTEGLRLTLTPQPELQPSDG
jgi:hypothetical protein